MNTPHVKKSRFMAVLLIAALALTSAGPALALGQPAAAPVSHTVVVGIPVLPFNSPAQPATQSPAPRAARAAQAAKISKLDFSNTMRQLWEEHVTWTRLYIVSVAANLPDQNLVAQRLLQNQVDIGNAIKPFYGEQAGDQLTALLKQHILIAAELLVDAKAGKTAAFNDANARWYANANQIAAFLSSANPKDWPLATVQDMMKMHLDLTLKEASDRLHGNYAADIQDYDAVEHEILGMADALSSGIIDQFPSMFK